MRNKDIFGHFIFRVALQTRTALDMTEPLRKAFNESSPSLSKTRLKPETISMQDVNSEY